MRSCQDRQRCVGFTRWAAMRTVGGRRDDEHAITQQQPRRHRLWIRSGRVPGRGLATLTRKKGWLLMMESFCIECDAAAGKCNHNGPRYLEPIEYERITTSNGQAAYIVTEPERERWDHPVKGTPPRSVTPDARPITELLENLEPWADISGPLETLLRAQHEADPGKTTRLVHYIIEQAKRGALRNPGGLLMTKLRG